ncbi:D-alanyl-D-alanine-carboxypeptidase/endopeptidase AmpH [Mesorhizobium sp.]|uniref:D-alanyl-D-alanine- carboxypeptidase/endopeptidase AmpH n=1 Tax=Mesorhizobium sp. TaxID=1871066 RepID=UPI000FE4EDAA|nr:D-alanyl-D-alanine-carboxypeptidase/endopeptidase AmpH [Mesorhizobium sp.]RWO52560.1 MAG: D-alanyl-D-alanine-carboxypeptidase/endopeptidase AmpH [Mesorhizobium sp.]TIN22665.1 MAG: D-alanyl-D-alanine-carboxypeptidase/endopeptidase AmpH [Mesorhizobium sp.]TIN35410.1 MAG: D-alanyl-D-alanine-carboxypeptidase/endopeptidase AmpH [Mesorhizobium sp.]TJU79046.1 MAG: D-alanyl-D-alanine-carboxypeptidase/endopeptidase AmpH [Mesorhizobium sp.]TJU84988.1 MAG: D-alanyl-D-alanine-carboxypeptidase/endopepti
MTGSSYRRFLISSAMAGCLFAVPQADAEDRLLEEAVGFTGVFAFLGSGAPGLVIAAVRNGETAFAGFGEISKGSGKTPDEHTLMRIGSISKAFCGDLMSGMVEDGTLGITDPLAVHLDKGWTVPEFEGRTLRLVDLVTQASGLPREVPNQTGGTPDNPFTGNTYELSRTGLAKGSPYLFPPGTGALYSNWGYDLLGLALSNAGGKSYGQLLADRVLVPRGMTDTKFNLEESDKSRTMQGHFFDGAPMPLVPTPETIGCAGGLYSSAADMQKWMAWHLDQGTADDTWRTINHAGWLWRDGLSPVSGLDDGGPMGMMTLGWVGLLPNDDKPLMLNKSGGLQGQFSYVVIAPTRSVGVFVSINQFSISGFNGMVEAANDLIAQLAPR